MKKTLLVMLLALPVFTFAQLTSDDFESYNVGAFDGQFDSNNWEGWFAGNSNTTISEDQALSGTKSMLVEQNDDIVALLGTLNQGSYEVTFSQYIPAGNGSYFNLQHNYTSSAGDWMIEVFFDANGGGAMTSDGSATTFSDVVYDEWAEIKVDLNFTTMIGLFSYNGGDAIEFAINTNAAGGPGLNQVNGINFFGACAPTGSCTALTYYDDITVTALGVPQFDALVSNPSTGQEYTAVPAGLEQPLTLGATVTNAGTDPLTNVVVNFIVIDGNDDEVFNNPSMTIAELASGEQMNVMPSEMFVPSTMGPYTVSYEVNVDEMDENPDNNMTSASIAYENSTDIYARDSGEFTDGLGTNGVNSILGQNFDFNNSFRIDSITFWHAGGFVNDSVRVEIYSVDGTGMPLELLASSETIALDAPGGGVGNELFKSFGFTDGVVLPEGEYFFGVVQMGINNLLVSTAESIVTPEALWAKVGENPWQSLGGNFDVAFSIRLLITEVGATNSTIIDSAVSNFDISPNPTNGNVLLDVQLKEVNDLQIEVFSVEGKRLHAIMDRNVKSTQYNVDLTDLPAGSYFVKLSVDGVPTVKKLIISK